MLTVCTHMMQRRLLGQGGGVGGRIFFVCWVFYSIYKVLLRFAPMLLCGGASLGAWLLRLLPRRVSNSWRNWRRWPPLLTLILYLSYLQGIISHLGNWFREIATSFTSTTPNNQQYINIQREERERRKMSMFNMPELWRNMVSNFDTKPDEKDQVRNE